MFIIYKLKRLSLSNLGRVFCKASSLSSVVQHEEAKRINVRYI